MWGGAAILLTFALRHMGPPTAEARGPLSQLGQTRPFPRDRVESRTQRQNPALSLIG